MPLLTEPAKLILRKTYIGLDDPDAAAYITAVEIADGQPLEIGVQVAIHSFVKGCKADGIWPAIKASCIMAGARTLNGALQPLVGTAPTSFNFVAGDYDRKTGLVGNGSTKYLNSNRNNNADPQNSKHIAVFAPIAPSPSAVTRNPGPACAGLGGSNTGGSGLPMDTQANNNQLFRVNGDTAAIVAGAGLSAGFRGASRKSSSTILARIGGTNYSSASSSQTPQNNNLTIFARNQNSTIDNFVDFRLAFYSIGESLDLALLDARVTALINAFAAAIPS